MRVLLTYNPKAGEDGFDPEELVSTLEAGSHRVEARSVKDDAWARGLADQPDLVVIAGGDGTVGLVLSRLAGRDVPATLVPVGSANNIAKSVGVDETSGRELIAHPAEARRVRFDVGAAAWEGGRSALVESAGGGLFADMLARAEEDGGKPGGEDKVELGLGLLRDAARDAHSGHWRLEVDGRDLSGELIAAEIMNVPLLGPNLPLAPGADPSDGLLDLALVRPEHAIVLAGYAEARLAKRPEPALKLETHRARTVVLEPPQGCPCHIDDELAPRWSGPVTGSITGGVDLLVPGA
jgi:diacylglycerol kinase (ATP)